MAACTTAMINRQRRLICAVMLPAIAVGHSLGYSLDLLPAAVLPLLFATILPSHKLFSTWPNCVTFLRTLLAILNALWPTGSPTMRCACGIAFVALDFVDGALARRLQQATPLGGLLDEEADAFGTLVASTELVRLGLAPQWLAMHQGSAHYLVRRASIRLPHPLHLSIPTRSPSSPTPAACPPAPDSWLPVAPASSSSSSGASAPALSGTCPSHARPPA